MHDLYLSLYTIAADSASRGLVGQGEAVTTFNIVIFVAIACSTAVIPLITERLLVEAHFCAIVIGQYLNYHQF